MRDADRHEFSDEYMEAKNRVLGGLQDAEGRLHVRRLHGVPGRLVRIAVIFISCVILVPVTVQAAMSIYRFTVRYHGGDAEIVIEDDGGGLSTTELSTENDRSGLPAEQAADNEASEGETSPGEWLLGSDGLLYYIMPGERYYDVEFSYLPDGLMRVEECKWASSYGGLDGISLILYNWDGGDFKTIDKNISEAVSHRAGAYQYLELQVGNVAADFNRHVYVPIKDKGLVVMMYVSRCISDEDITKLVAGMRITDAGDDVSRKILVMEPDSFSSYEVYSFDTKESDISVGDTARCVGYTMTIDDIGVYDRLTEDDLDDIFVDKSSLQNVADTRYDITERDAFVERYLEKDGTFKELDCRYVVKTSDDWSFTEYGDTNTGRMAYVCVTVTYTDVSVEEYELVTPHLSLAGTDAVNYFVLDDGSMEAVTCEIPVSVRCISGDRATGETIKKNGGAAAYTYRIGFFVDESELDMAYVSFTASRVGGDGSSCDVYMLKATEK